MKVRGRAPITRRASSVTRTCCGMDRRLDSPPGLALALLDALAVADPELGAHSGSVAELAGRVAARLGLAPTDCEDVRLAAALHDVGKLALPDSILQKPGPLDADGGKLM